MHAEKPKGLDDDFMEWETRHESIPFYRHIIAGKLDFPYFILRFMRWHHGTRRNVSFRHSQGKSNSYSASLYTEIHSKLT